MEDQLLKILENSYDEYTTMDLETNEISGELRFNPETAAEEITQHVFEFLVWICKQKKYTVYIDIHDVLWFEATDYIENDNEYTINEVYNDWIDNIKK